MCINHMLTILLVLCIQYVGSEENKNPKKILIVTQKETEIENHTRQNVFNKNINARSSLTCNSNEWICDGKCIHKREYCVENSQCHPTYPIPCGDKVRCYRQVYIYSKKAALFISNAFITISRVMDWIYYVIFPWTNKSSYFKVKFKLIGPTIQPHFSLFYKDIVWTYATIKHIKYLNLCLNCLFNNIMCYQTLHPFVLDALRAVLSVFTQTNHDPFHI